MGMGRDTTRMLHDGQLDQDLRQLNQYIVDLGVAIEERYMNAVSLIISREWSTVRAFTQTPLDVAPVTLEGEATRIIQRWLPNGDRLGMALSLQAAAREFDIIFAIIGRLAEKALAIDGGRDGDVDHVLNLLDSVSHQAFYQIIRSGYVQLRGCVIALSTGQVAIAQHTMEADGVLDHAFLTFQASAQAIIHEDLSARALPITLLRVIAGDIEELGNHVTRICAQIERRGLSLAPDDSAPGYAAQA